MGLFSACSGPGAGVPPLRPVCIPSEQRSSHEETDRIREAYENFALASLAMSRGLQDEAEKYLERAIEMDPLSLYLCKRMVSLLKGLKDYENAIAYGRKCLNIEPGDVESLTSLGDLYALSSHDDLAILQYATVLNLDPENERIRLILATLMIKKGQLSEALEHLEILTEENPGHVIAQYYSGRIYLETGRYQEAEEAFLQALQFNKRLEPALFGLGTLYQLTDRHSDAIATYERLLGSYPNNMSAKERLVDLYFKAGLEEQAELQLEEIKGHSLPGEQGRQALGLLYLRQGRLEESIKELSLIVTAWPEDENSRYYLATAHEESGNMEKALEHFRLITPESEYYSNVRIHIAYILQGQDKHQEAIATLDKAIVLKKTSPELYLVLASLYESIKEYGKAVEVAKEGLKQDEKNIDLMFRLGVILDKSGDKTSCISQMRKILEIDPDSADTLNYIGYSYAEQGIRLEEALRLIQKALMLEPDNGYIMDSLGWVYYQQGLYHKAIRHLEKAVEFTPHDPTIRDHLGDAYSKIERYERSLKYYEKALSLDHPDEKKLREKVEEMRRLLE